MNCRHSAALHQFTSSAFFDRSRHTLKVNDTPLRLEEVANGVVHPVTKEILKQYKGAIDDPLTGEIWAKVMYK